MAAAPKAPIGEELHRALDDTGHGGSLTDARDVLYYALLLSVNSEFATGVDKVMEQLHQRHACVARLRARQSHTPMQRAGRRRVKCDTSDHTMIMLSYGSLTQGAVVLVCWIDRWYRLASRCSQLAVVARVAEYVL